MENEIILEEGEVICSKCEGHGCLPPEITRMDEMQMTCPKCNGERKVDWVANAMEEVPLYSGSHCSSSSFSAQAPANIQIGDMVYITSDHELKVYDGSNRGISFQPGGT